MLSVILTFGKVVRVRHPDIYGLSIHHAFVQISGAQKKFWGSQGRRIGNPNQLPRNYHHWCTAPTQSLPRSAPPLHSLILSLLTNRQQPLSSFRQTLLDLEERFYSTFPTARQAKLAEEQYIAPSRLLHWITGSRSLTAFAKFLGWEETKKMSFITGELSGRWPRWGGGNVPIYNTRRWLNTTFGAYIYMGANTGRI